MAILDSAAIKGNQRWRFLEISFWEFDNHQAWWEARAASVVDSSTLAMEFDRSMSRAAVLTKETIEFFDLRSWKPLKSIPRPRPFELMQDTPNVIRPFDIKIPHIMAFQSNRTLLYIGEEGQIYEIDLDDGKVSDGVRLLNPPYRGSVYLLNAASNRLAGGVVRANWNDDQLIRRNIGVRVWDTRTGTPIFSRNTRFQNRTLGFSADGRSVMWVNSGSNVAIADVDTAHESNFVFEDMQISSASLHPSGSSIVIYGWSQSGRILRRISSSNGEILTEKHVPLQEFNLSHTSDGKFVVLLGLNQQLDRNVIMVFDSIDLRKVQEIRLQRNSRLFLKRPSFIRDTSDFLVSLRFDENSNVYLRHLFPDTEKLTGQLCEKIGQIPLIENMRFPEPLRLENGIRKTGRCD